MKRRIQFKNPVLDFQRIVFIDQPYPKGGALDHEAIHRMGHHGGSRRPVAAARRTSPGRQAPATCAGQAGQLLAAGCFLRRQARALLLQGPRRKELSPLRNELGRHGAAADHRQRVRRHRPGLPARRPHRVHHDARQHVCPLRAVHLLLRPGPLRRGRQQRLPDQPQQRAGFRAGGDERRPRHLFPLGIHRQTALAHAERLDDQPRRHRDTRRSGATRPSGPICWPSRGRFPAAGG